MRISFDLITPPVQQASRLPMIIGAVVVAAAVVLIVLKIRKK